ncbi:sigma-70 family RNA polymerase sigma factor [Sulfoacidibacillus thermotolerans]|uniref:HTH luxR-type domain-containing protein n=1 Tax=Sulfoacidibacillus thermotolerans TaxID=1765684 RepID=A0A2U3D642_SULT2|nr:sigma-70 family RNA polymerase sigma factor [Sulfoacidibacillus thermotolerans]PWI56752.1 hypothetical protein BM613_12050 [Sulfoacidibacillus thermotolerans]
MAILREKFFYSIIFLRVILKRTGPKGCSMTFSASPNATEESLLQLVYAAQQGTPAALSELCTRFTPLVVRLARYYQTSSLPSEDVVQCGYEHLLRAIRAYDTRHGVYFRHFVKLRVRAGIWSCVRSANRTAARIQKEPALQEETQDAELLLQIADTTALAAYDLSEWSDLFALLSPREQIALEQVILQGASSTLVAARYGVSPETVKTWRKRALKKLARALQD